MLSEFWNPHRPGHSLVTCPLNYMRENSTLTVYVNLYLFSSIRVLRSDVLQQIYKFILSMVTMKAYLVHIKSHIPDKS